MHPSIDVQFAPTEVEASGEAAHDGSRGMVAAWLHKLGLGASRDQDPLARLPGRRAFIASAAEKLGRGRGSLALFDFSDLLELRSFYGSHAEQDALRHVVEAMERLAGRTGIAARTGPVQFAVLLPGLQRGEAIDLAHETLGRPCRIELELQREDVVLVPDVVVDTCEGTGRGAVESLYLCLAVTLARHRDREVRRLDRMRRQRERHSRPFDASQRDSLPASLPG